MFPWAASTSISSRTKPRKINRRFSYSFQYAVHKRKVNRVSAAQIRLESQMTISSEMRKLQNKWRAGSAWPKRLEWIEILGIRGWTGQKVEFQFPIVALVGENGSGKSTVLQAAASAYKAPSKKEELFGSDFFPDTPFERIEGASIRFSFREGAVSQVKTVRKPTDRWRGNPERPERRIHNVDLRESSQLVRVSGI